MRGARSLGAIFVLSTILTSCGTSQKKYEANPDSKHWMKEPIKLRGKQGKRYREIRRLYSKGAYSTALRKIRKFEKRYPRSKAIAHVYNLHGLINLYKKKPLRAIHRFRTALKQTQDDNFKNFVHYNLASAQFEARRISRAERTLEKVEADALNLDTRLKFHYLKTLIYQRRKKPVRAAHEILAASYLYSTEVKSRRLRRRFQRTRRLFERQLRIAFRKIKSPATLESLYSNYQDSQFAELLLYRVGSRSVALGQSDLAERHLRHLIKVYPRTKYYDKAVSLLRQIQVKSTSDGLVVGVLVPMTGRYGKFGKKTLHGIELAFHVYNHEEPDTRVTLVVEDSGSTPEQAIKALDKLFFEHHAAAIIGPLVSKGVEQVTERAQDLGVPTISLAQHLGTEGDYIFNTSVTGNHQAEEIARFAIEKYGMKRFAILYPEDKFGTQHKDYFWDAVEAMGGQIVGAESYTPKETDFRTTVDKIAGLHYKEARQRELDALASLREEENITRRTRKTEKYYKLEPIVDYDAVFIPDSAKTVSQILPMFAYRDVEKVKYLGLATWNDRVLVKRSGRYAQNALFVDIFYPHSSDPVVTRFVSKFEATFGYLPTALEAVAYDAASLLEEALLTSDQNVIRAEIRDKLTNIENYQGVTGRITYREGGFKRELKVLTVRKRRITEAPQTPPPVETPEQS